MTENRSDAEAIGVIIELLSSNEPAVRQKAREQLVEMGSNDVTRAMVGLLADPQRQVRWEAVKALTAIADPVAAPGLLHAMEDDDEDVRWVAGEGIIALGKDGLRSVLSGLTRRARSLEFCKGAHHVLHELKGKGYADTVEPVLNALETSEPGFTAPLAAYQALLALKNDDG